MCYAHSTHVYYSNNKLDQLLIHWYHLSALLTVNSFASSLSGVCDCLSLRVYSNLVGPDII